MSQVEMIEREIRRLPAEQARALHEWLADYMEDLEELRPEFVESIERGKEDIAAGRCRVRKP